MLLLLLNLNYKSDLTIFSAIVNFKFVIVGVAVVAGDVAVVVVVVVVVVVAVVFVLILYSS